MNDLYKDQNSADGPVECLGLKFPNDRARSKHFLKLLAEKLKDPVFRKTEGFPKGPDEAILAMSDPPYYTACPNPFALEFIKHHGTAYDPEVPYAREPFASDVSEGKSDPIYNVHAYATKVPPGAIEPLITHYLNGEGGVVLDPFAGTGMVGVAVTRADKSAIAVLQDLSPAATHIASEILSEINHTQFQFAAESLLDEVEAECGWMYATHIKSTESNVRYYVWSDVYACASCSQPVRIWDIEGTKSVGGLKEGLHNPGSSLLARA